MSFSRSGPIEAVNSVGKLRFTKWYLHKTSMLKDIWRKREVEDLDSFIEIERTNVFPYNKEYTYCIRFVGITNFLITYYKSCNPQYEDFTSVLQFDSIESAKEMMDSFLARIDNLKVFI